MSENDNSINENSPPVSSNVIPSPQTSASENLPPTPPESREVKQDVIGVDERNLFEKETKIKK